MKRTESGRRAMVFDSLGATRGNTDVYYDRRIYGIEGLTGIYRRIPAANRRQWRGWLAAFWDGVLIYLVPAGESMLELAECGLPCEFTPASYLGEHTSATEEEEPQPDLFSGTEEARNPNFGFLEPQPDPDPGPASVEPPEPVAVEEPEAPQKKPSRRRKKAEKPVPAPPDHPVEEKEDDGFDVPDGDWGDEPPGNGELFATGKKRGKSHLEERV